MFYCFYSRETGYPDAPEIRSFTSKKIFDPLNNTKIFIGLTGKEILSNLSKYNYPMNLIVKKRLIKMCNKNLDWYYYQVGTIITSHSADW